MTPTQDKSTDELVAEEEAARRRLRDLEESVTAAFMSWKPIFLAAVRSAVHDQARHAAKRAAEHTLNMTPKAIATLKDEVAALAEDNVAQLDAEVTLERISRAKPDARGLRGVDEGPHGAHAQLLAPVEEGIGRLMERAGYDWRGWVVPGSSRAWDGPQLDTAERGAFQQLARRIGDATQARIELARASDRVRASLALEAWGD